MSIDALLAELKQLERPISDDARDELLADLRVYPSGIDGRRTTEWKRGNIYFHALQDTLAAEAIFRGTFVRYSDDEQIDYLKSSQACFTQDLDKYLAEFPKEEDEKMKELFELIFKVGTSKYWTEDQELVT